MVVMLPCPYLLYVYTHHQKSLDICGGGSHNLTERFAGRNELPTCLVIVEVSRYISLFQAVCARGLCACNAWVHACMRACMCACMVKTMEAQPYGST